MSLVKQANVFHSNIQIICDIKISIIYGVEIGIYSLRVMYYLDLIFAKFLA